MSSWFDNQSALSSSSWVSSWSVLAAMILALFGCERATEVAFGPEKSGPFNSEFGSSSPGTADRSSTATSPDMEGWIALINCLARDGADMSDSFVVREYVPFVP
jgi:hypothetical protein